MCEDIFRNDIIKNVKNISILIETNFRQSIIGRDQSILIQDDTESVGKFLDNADTVKTQDKNFV